MTRRKFTKEEIEELSKNIHVSKCSEKAITYTKDFKIFAVKRYLEEGLSPAQIFKDAGFERFCSETNVAKLRLFEWRKIYEAKGEAGLSVENRGRSSHNRSGRLKTKGLTDADKIERMEATIAYLKTENAFLAKLRAARKE